MAFEKLYTAEEVAQITGLTLRTIRNYIKDGRLKGHRVGVQWRFTEADIQALFAGPDSTSDTAITTSSSSVTEEAIAAAVASATAAAAAAAATAAPVAPAIMPAASAPAEEEPLSEMQDQIRRFVERKNAPRSSACVIVDKPGMTAQEALFLYNRLQTLAQVYANSPKRLEVTYEYDENRDQARFVFSGALDAACSMLNLCDVQ